MHCMSNRVRLIHEDLDTISDRSGQGKVYTNLTLGLSKLDIEITDDEEEYTGWLHGPPYDAKPNWLLGPNIFSLPIEMSKEFWETKRNIVVPSEWVKDLFQHFIGEDHNIFVLPVGIDTEKFHSTERGNDCLLYFKDGDYHVLNEIKNKLDQLGINHNTLVYGSYHPNDMVSLTKKSKFAVLITNTESQGIAYQEILSMNLPCYVVDRRVWIDKPGPGSIKVREKMGWWNKEVPSFPATSAPYFDDRCGIKHPDLSRFDEFLAMVNEYSPREYILENLTLEKCAGEYLSLLEFCNEHRT